MTTNQMPVQRCQYCGSDDLGLGWQHGEALVTYKKHGLLGSRLRSRTPGQPASVSDLPPLWGRGVSMGSGASQISAYQVSHPKIASQIKDKNLGGDGNGKAKTIRRRHGS